MGRSVEAARPIHTLGLCSLPLLPFNTSTLLLLFFLLFSFYSSFVLSSAVRPFSTSLIFILWSLIFGLDLFQRFDQGPVLLFPAYGDSQAVRQFIILNRPGYKSFFQQRLINRICRFFEIDQNKIATKSPGHIFPANAVANKYNLVLGASQRREWGASRHS